MTATEITPTTPEALLLKRWQSHCDREALGELLKRQRNRAYSIAYHLMGRSADAEDAVQDAFLKLLNLRKEFSTLEAFRVAIYFAVLQSATDLLRRRRRQEKHEALMLANQKNSYGHVAGGNEGALEETAERRERHMLLREALSALSLDQRMAVILRYQQGLSLTQAAGVLAVPRQTLHDRLAKALAELRSHLHRRGVVLSLAFLEPALNDAGAVQAPPALCAALDRLLPGRPCAELIVEAPRPPCGPRNDTAGKSIFIGAAGMLFIPLAISLAVMAPISPGGKAGQAEPFIRSPSAETAVQSTPGTSKRSMEMGLKELGNGLVLGAALALPGAVQAGEADTVGEILKQIREHVAQKQELASAKKTATSEFEWIFMGGGVEQFAIVTTDPAGKAGDCPDEASALKVLTGHWSYFVDANPEHWELGPASGETTIRMVEVTPTLPDGK